MPISPEITGGEPEEEAQKRIEAPIWEAPQVKYTAEALASLEAGEVHWGVELTSAMLQDLSTESYLEDHERPDKYTVSKLASLFGDVKAECEKAISSIEKGEPPKSLKEWKDLDSAVDDLRARAEFARGEGDYGSLGPLQGKISEQERKLSNARQKVTLMGEDIESLSVDLTNEDAKREVLERLEAKKEQLDQFRRASSEMGKLGEHYYVFKEAASDISKTKELAIIPGYGRLSATRLAALTSLPGLKPGLDFSFQKLLQLDNANPQTINGEDYEKNLCAMEAGITVKNREKFRQDLIRDTANYLLEQGIENHLQMARESVQLAFAFHDIFFVSMVFDRPRNSKMEPMDPIKKRVDVDMDGGAGSMHGLFFVDGTDKLMGAGTKLRKDALDGYPAPITFAILNFTDRLILDLLHNYKFSPDKDDRNTFQLQYLSGAGNLDYYEGTAFDFIESGKGGLSEVLGSIPENFHALYLLGPFHAAKVWEQVNNMPLEQIKIHMEKLDPAYNAIRQLSEWAADTHKRLDKVLNRVYEGKDYAKALSTMLLMNLLGAAWRRMSKTDIIDGGDYANVGEEGDLLGSAAKMVETYFDDYFVDNNAILTPKQMVLLGQLVDNKEVVSLSEVDLKNKPWLKDVLAERPEKIDKDLAVRTKILKGSRSPAAIGEWRVMEKAIEFKYSS